ncbi:hypothetical protein [Methylovulum psychrotolerans]|uniref:DUF2116 family Zn-ribbon domain-containing protein n=1 Tax=Methylovulum psychrotolerans TaxID=1704499 RepID=A0A2S5CGD1_9GAMM|nr:hypothetical protein [Methylovulum psychrotolerans]POZ49870.1 hypothetical protein AADEFJLK_04316 [Methylovulum psychrotolerans]
MDDVDHSQGTIEIHTSISLYLSKKDVPPSEATGECWNCGAKLAGPKRWCDAICRDEWQAREE